MFSRLAHVCLNVRNLADSLEFYRKLGFAPRFDFTRTGKPFGAYLEIAPNQYLEMFENPDLEPSVGNRAGIAHFCLESEDLDATMAGLREAGIPFTEKKIGCDHTWQIWLRDPDGNDFEVHQYTGRSLQRLGGTVEADW